MPDEFLSMLERELGGVVTHLERLSGGASRVTSAFDLVRDDHTSRFILQQDRGRPSPFALGAVVESRILAAAAAAGVPVPEVVATGEFDGANWMVVKRVEGETIPRRILRDDQFAVARATLAAQCGTALAKIHSIDPHNLDGLPRRDRLADPLVAADMVGLQRPVIEFGGRWLATHPLDPLTPVTVHGDFRMGNLLVDGNGLTAVLDWELAHAGDPAEDLGWLCARTWRFGGEGRVGGVGDLDDLLTAYRAAGGTDITSERVAWWEVHAAVKWGVICALQSSGHLLGAHRSVELAAIGRRVAESEWDLLVRLGLTDHLDGAPAPTVRTFTPPFARPDAYELVEAVREYLDGELVKDKPSFGARVARNALAIAERELALGDSIRSAHARRIATLGFSSQDELCRALRAGELDSSLEQIGTVLASSVRDELLVANPAHLNQSPTDSTSET